MFMTLGGLTFHEIPHLTPSLKMGGYIIQDHPIIHSDLGERIKVLKEFVFLMRYAVFVPTFLAATAHTTS